MLLNSSLPAKAISGLTLIGLMSLSIGCNQTVQSKVIPSAETPAPKPVIAHSPSDPPQSLPHSNEIADSTILEGRYWIGHTGQALEVEGDASGTGKPARYRYETEGGTQPWRPTTELQAVKEGVIYDGNSYWCLSSMAPQGQVASCSEKGWITTPEFNPL